MSWGQYFFLTCSPKYCSRAMFRQVFALQILYMSSPPLGCQDQALLSTETRPPRDIALVEQH